MSFFALHLGLLLLALEGQFYTQPSLPSAYIYTITRFHNPMIPLAICISVSCTYPRSLIGRIPLYFAFLALDTFSIICCLNVIINTCCRRQQGMQKK